MIRMMRKNVLVGLGNTINRLGAELIETPDIYKQIDSRGKILSVGSKCKKIKQEDIGKECLIDIIHFSEYRLSPKLCAQYGLEGWNFIVNEDNIQLLMEK